MWLKHVFSHTWLDIQRISAVEKVRRIACLERHLSDGDIFGGLEVVGGQSNTWITNVGAGGAVEGGLNEYRIKKLMSQLRWPLTVWQCSTLCYLSYSVYMTKKVLLWSHCDNQNLIRLMSPRGCLCQIWLKSIEVFLRCPTLEHGRDEHMGNPKNNAVSRAETCRTKERQEFSYREERKIQLPVVLTWETEERIRLSSAGHTRRTCITGYFLNKSSNLTWGWCEANRTSKVTHLLDFKWDLSV